MVSNTYTPDRWVVLKIGTMYKVLAGWSGGYLDGDYWRLNSGITKVEQEGDYWLFHGNSGSIYKCHKGGDGFTSLSGQVYMQLVDSYGKDSIKLMDEETEWDKLL